MEKLPPEAPAALEITNLKEVNEIIATLEKEYNISILYACESESKAHGTSVASSDHDLKGFYYSLLTPSSPGMTHIQASGQHLGSYPIPFDYEFFEVSSFLDSIAIGHNPSPLRWLISTLVYRNTFPAIRETILKSCSPCHQQCFNRMNKVIDSIIKNKAVQAKGLVKFLIDTMFIVYMNKTGNYPIHYNIFHHMDDLKELAGNGTAESDLYEKFKVLIQQGVYHKETKTVMKLESWASKYVKDVFNKEKEFLKSWTPKWLTVEEKSQLMKAVTSGKK